MRRVSISWKRVQWRICISYLNCYHSETIVCKKIDFLHLQSSYLLWNQSVLQVHGWNFSNCHTILCVFLVFKYNKIVIFIEPRFSCHRTIWAQGQNYFEVLKPLVLFGFRCLFFFLIHSIHKILKIITFRIDTCGLHRVK